MKTKHFILIILAVFGLAIAFFIYTIKTAQPESFELFTSTENKKDGPAEPLTDCSFSLILGKDELVYFYIGDSVKHMYKTSIAPNLIRDILKKGTSPMRREIGGTN